MWLLLRVDGLIARAACIHNPIIIIATRKRDQLATEKLRSEATSRHTFAITLAWWSEQAPCVAFDNWRLAFCVPQTVNAPAHAAKAPAHVAKAPAHAAKAPNLNRRRAGLKANTPNSTAGEPDRKPDPTIGELDPFRQAKPTHQRARPILATRQSQAISVPARAKDMPSANHRRTRRKARTCQTQPSAN